MNEILAHPRFTATIMAMLALGFCGYRFGALPEKIGVSIYAGSFFASVGVALHRMSLSFVYEDIDIIVIDCVTFGAMCIFALYANRIWPTIIASLQLLVIFPHVAVRLVDTLDRVYWGLMVGAQYLQLIVIGFGIYTHRRRYKAIGRYEDWDADPQVPAEASR